MLKPDQTAPGLPREKIYEDVFRAVSGQISDDHSFKPIFLKQRMVVPFLAKLARVFIPPNALPPHPARADDVRAPVIVDVYRSFIVVVDIRSVGLRAITVVGVFRP